MTMAYAPSAAARLAIRGPRTAPRAVIIHPSEVVRAGLNALLSSGNACSVTASVAALSDAQRSLTTNSAPAVILYAYNPRMGSAATALVAEFWPEARRIALAEGGPAMAETCLRAGAHAAVAIDGVTRDVLLELIRHLLNGEYGQAVGFDPSAADDRRLFAEVGVLAALTPRERELFYLIGEGHSNNMIADMLRLSVKTVETHRTNISRKLGITTRAGLVRAALHAGGTVG